MKKRTGFVSNSSSSSFVINKDNLSFSQIKAIKDHANSESFDKDYLDNRDIWNIDETSKTIIGSTSMDNFDMEAFFEKIGVNFSDIEWRL